MTSATASIGAWRFFFAPSSRALFDSSPESSSSSQEGIRFPERPSRKCLVVYATKSLPMRPSAQTQYEVDIRRSMFAGIMAYDETFDFNCPSGQCERPPFDTLGMCSTCHDVSAELAVSCAKPYNSTASSCYHTLWEDRSYAFPPGDAFSMLSGRTVPIAEFPSTRASL